MRLVLRRKSASASFLLAVILKSLLITSSSVRYFKGNSLRWIEPQAPRGSLALRHCSSYSWSTALRQLLDRDCVSVWHNSNTLVKSNWKHHSVRYNILHFWYKNSNTMLIIFHWSYIKWNVFLFCVACFQRRCWCILCTPTLKKLRYHFILSLLW